jgi:catechol 2,3-dioxygenase-like lactoylglutathione lyase family enzyme
MASFRYSAATLPVSDLDRAREFYEKKLGLTVDEETAAGVLYRVGGGDSRLFVYPSQFAGTNQATSASFDVEDIAATVAELRGMGITFEEYDFPGLKTVDGIAELDGELGAWFKDPDGNILALGQRTSG